MHGLCRRDCSGAADHIARFATRNNPNVINALKPITLYLLIISCSNEMLLLFLLIHVAITTAAIRYGATTIADGCALFNTTKICAMVASGFESVYSIMMTFR